MLLFEFSIDALKLVSAYVDLLQKHVYQRFSIEVDKQGLGFFLSDVEDDIKFSAIQVSSARGANNVELQDVQEVSRRRLSGFSDEAEVFCRFYKKTLGDVTVLKERAKRLGALWILDVGCGWGRASRRLSKYLNREMEFVEIDLDAASLRYGKYVNRNFSFVRAHMSYLPFKSSVFDVVISNRSLHEARDKNNNRRIFMEFGEVLGSKGLLWVFDMFERYYLTKLMRKLLRKLFSKGEPYFERAEFERELQRTNFTVVRKTCMVRSPFSLNRLCSYIAVKS